MQKSWLLGAIVTGLGFLNAFAAALLMRSILTDATITPLLILAVLVTLLWAVLIAIALTLIKSPLLRTSIIVAAGLAVVAAGTARLGAIGGAFLLVLVLAMAQRAFTRESTNRLVFRTRDVFTMGTRLVIIGLILAAAGLALPVVETSIAKDGLKITRDQTAVVLRPVAPILEQLVADESLITNQETLPAVSTSPTPAPAVLVDVVTASVNSTLRNLSQQYPLLIAGMVIILAFLTLRAAVPLIAWIVVLSIAATLWAAHRLRFTKVVTISTTAERLEL